MRAPCPGLWTSPGTRDYELTVRYRLSSTGEVTITDRTVRVGTCGGAQPWSAAVLDQPWLIEMVGGVVPGDTGSYLLEGRLSAPTSGLISPILSISWTNTLRNGGTQTFPLPPPERVYSWPVRGEIDGPDLAADASSWQPVAFLPSPSPGSLPLSESAVSER